jgi:CRP-like cAMP-binding protein
LQAPALRRLNEKHQFINNSPFFGQWSQKMKKLLSLCLERELVPYDSFLSRQGEPADRVYFIRSGQAKVTVQPSMHAAQYPSYFPLQ